MEQDVRDDVEPDINGDSMTKRSADIKLPTPVVSGEPGSLGSSHARAVPDRMLALTRRLQAALDDRIRKANPLHSNLRSKKG
jgi:hypothetical protein